MREGKRRGDHYVLGYSTGVEKNDVD